MKLKILYHDNCFDGAASAALFSRFYRAQIDPRAEISYQGVQHRPGDPFGPHAFDGDENVCVDFRYSISPKLTWWFDHHVSAFQPAAEKAHFDADTSGKKFYDPQARSCTKFEAGILRDKFGWDIAPFVDLIHWADIIDGAQFPDARTAVELKAPALRLMTWIENNKDHTLKPKLIEEMGERTIAEIAEEPWVTGPLEPIYEKHHAAIELVRARAVEKNGVVLFDLLDQTIDAHNKFIAYMLFPDCRYTVGLTRSATRVKLSIGSNPWAPVPRTHNIAEICERYGGGGHPVVGAISLPPEDSARAREIGATIVAELGR